MKQTREMEEEDWMKLMKNRVINKNIFKKQQQQKQGGGRGGE